MTLDKLLIILYKKRASATLDRLGRYMSNGKDECYYEITGTIKAYDDIISLIEGDL